MRPALRPMSASERKLAPSASREAQLRALKARKPQAPKQTAAQPKTVAIAPPIYDISANEAPHHHYEPNYEATAHVMEEVDEAEA